jgi:hypothetical protein
MKGRSPRITVVELPFRLDDLEGEIPMNMKERVAVMTEARRMMARANGLSEDTVRQFFEKRGKK